MRFVHLAFVFSTRLKKLSVNDLPGSADSGSLNILLLYSAVFDTVNHNVLISHVSSIDIAGISLQWFRSNRQQFITKVSTSPPPFLLYVVSHRDQFLGTLSFNLYPFPWSD